VDEGAVEEVLQAVETVWNSVVAMAAAAAVAATGETAVERALAPADMVTAEPALEQAAGMAATQCRRPHTRRSRTLDNRNSRSGAYLGCTSCCRT
jgi:hypothetical protein